MYCYFISNRRNYLLYFPFLNILIIDYFKGFKYSGDFNSMVKWGFEYNSIDRLLAY